MTPSMLLSKQVRHQKQDQIYAKEGEIYSLAMTRNQVAIKPPALGTFEKKEMVGQS